MTGAWSESVVEERVSIATVDGAFEALVVRPAALPAAVVVVVQEIFGINDDMKATCRELAEAGFIAVCPDLFWRQEPGLSLSHWTPAEWARGLELYAAFDFDKGVDDIGATIQFARTSSGATGKVGVMGYCLGGLMTYLTAARVGADACVEYYGGGTQNHLQESGAIASPLMIHLGEDDEYIPPEAQDRIKQALVGHPMVQLFTYPGCDHAFARHSGEHYDPLAAGLANARTWAFLGHYLGHPAQAA
jgi:carboxymethylenebutenolidase